MTGSLSGTESIIQPSLEGTIDLWPGVPDGGFNRVLLKLSGEAFAGGGSLGVDPDIVQAIARESAAGQGREQPLRYCSLLRSGRNRHC